ncbi:OmpA family protein [Tenacibaculum sp. IB213877]|uniref:OmpA family protein n=1 Tax=Tenacibaculum sp. IB213877 TaxID=3097351 RepID=UPI002A59DD82|nr:OmpA family protein [Tenacibaculum sp. IB213877]MDY0781012.1 OmpA family protein [Tenacibaculum sp. IB213877]
MIIKKTILLLTVVFCYNFIYGQNRYAADRYFKEFAYKKSAELYKSIYEKGDESYITLSRLGDSYYYNVDFEKAEHWYEKLMEKYQNEVSSNHIFRYAQTLKGNGKVKESDEWMLKLKKVSKNDSRVKYLEQNKEYFSEYTNKEKTFINIHNLSINSKYSDFGGFIYNDYLFFSSTRPDENKKQIYKWNNQPYLDIYKTKNKLVDNQNFLEVDEIEKEEQINSKYHESNPIITKDGLTIYFTRDNFDGKNLEFDKQGKTHLKIFKAEWVDGKWINIQELPFNSNEYSTGHPALSEDEQTLYFVSDMPNGYGGTDLYKVSILEDGSFGTPENLGNTINTESREMFPFIDSNNNLYFASDGHLGLGALDVFESKLNEEKKYTKPVNLGSPINSSLDDFAFVIDNYKGYGYFSSNRKGGKGDDDIYSFLIYKCKEDIKGLVTEANTNKPLSNVTIRLIDEEGKPIATQQTKQDGSYFFKKIDCEKKYTIAATKDDYKPFHKNTQTLDVNEKILQTDIQLESLIIEDQIVINPIFFDFNSSKIKEDAEYELEHIVSVMKNHPEMIIKIESHTDSRGTKTYNRILSDKRAKSTRDYIISRGIAKERIQSAIGYGEDRLLNHCNDNNKCTEEEHQKNRRSYFYILN